MCIVNQLSEFNFVGRLNEVAQAEIYLCGSSIIRSDSTIRAACIGPDGLFFQHAPLQDVFGAQAVTLGQLLQICEVLR